MIVRYLIDWIKGDNIIAPQQTEEERKKELVKHLCGMFKESSYRAGLSTLDLEFSEDFINNYADSLSTIDSSQLKAAIEAYHEAVGYTLLPLPEELLGFVS